MAAPPPPGADTADESAAALVLPRPRPLRGTIPLTPMIDVLLILLIFFMVTSSYLDLDMIPAAGAPEAPGTAAPPLDSATRPGTLLLRIGADGGVAQGGRVLDGAALDALLARAAEAGGRVVVLPSGAAPVQALVGLMDRATQTGVRDLDILRLEEAR